MKSSETPYTKPGRLQDVLSLIQVLALDEYTRRTKDGIEKELQSPRPQLRIGSRLHKSTESSSE